MERELIGYTFNRPLMKIGVVVEVYRGDKYYFLRSPCDDNWQTGEERYFEVVYRELPEIEMFPTREDASKALLLNILRDEW